jgi:hypothetical protein
MPQKGTFHTTMTDKVRVALYQYKRDNPQLSQKDLIKWLEDNHNIKVSKAIISTTLKRSAEILAKSDNETLMPSTSGQSGTWKWSPHWSNGFGQTRNVQM